MMPFLFQVYVDKAQRSKMTESAKNYRGTSEIPTFTLEQAKVLLAKDYPEASKMLINRIAHDAYYPPIKLMKAKEAEFVGDWSKIHRMPAIDMIRTIRNIGPTDPVLVFYSNKPEVAFGVNAHPYQNTDMYIPSDGGSLGFCLASPWEMSKKSVGHKGFGERDFSGIENLSGVDVKVKLNDRKEVAGKCIKMLGGLNSDNQYSPLVLVLQVGENKDKEIPVEKIVSVTYYSGNLKKEITVNTDLAKDMSKIIPRKVD